MNDSSGYAVFFFPQALEVLGTAIRPYLQDGPAGVHVLCREIDTGGTLIEMRIDVRSPDGRPVSLELMVPASMVRMVVSVHSDGTFGFAPRDAGLDEMLPPVGPTAMPAEAQPQAVPTPVGTPPTTPEGVPAETLTRTPPKP